ncbi:MAG: rhomboid family intramembrane serine protease [Agathobacter sp.]|nr:rhomboid family intramembrane serine protease [Agathobacter sp.]
MHNKNYYDSKPYITMAVIAVNIIVFAVMSIFGNTLDAQYMAGHGAMYPPYVAENGQYWRLFTSMFMHFGLMHILNNMVMLGAVGRIVEIAMGHVRFLIAYIVAGICGGALSYVVMLHNNDYAVSAGASGAIFGMVGALVWIVIVNRGFYEGISRQQVIFMVILMIYYGVSTSGVDNWDHLGGLAGGFIISIVLYRKKRYNKNIILE